MRLLAVLLVLAATSVASANHDSFAARRTLLRDVSADPRDGQDFIDTGQCRSYRDLVSLAACGRFDRLELRARAAPVRLHGVRVELANGRTWHETIHRVLAPGQSARLDLPRGARIGSLVIDYGDPATRLTDRTPARLEIFGLDRYRF